MTTKRNDLTPVQEAAYERIARHILVGRYARVSTLDRQQAVFSSLNRRDALVVANAIYDQFGGALKGVAGVR